MRLRDRLVLGAYAVAGLVVGLACTPGTRSGQCGGQGQPCCGSGACDNGLVCESSFCRPLGDAGFAADGGPAGDAGMAPDSDGGPGGAGTSCASTGLCAAGSQCDADSGTCTVCSTCEAVIECENGCGSTNNACIAQIGPPCDSMCGTTVCENGMAGLGSTTAAGCFEHCRATALHDCFTPWQSCVTECGQAACTGDDATEVESLVECATDACESVNGTPQACQAVQTGSGTCASVEATCGASLANVTSTFNAPCNPEN